MQQNVTQKAEAKKKSDNQEDAVVITINAESSSTDAKGETPESSGGDQEQQLQQQREDLGPDAIQVRILDLNGKFFNIPCRLDWQVSLMKQKVLECTEVPIAAQRLIYRGRVLEDESVLADYKVEDGHTIHLFVRMSQTPDLETLNADAATSGVSGSHGSRLEDGSQMTIVHISNDIISSAVFPSDSARRVDPLMLDSPLGNCARRVKLWSSFLLIIYTMKVMGQFALLANDQQARSQQSTAEGQAAADREDQRERMYDYPQYYNQDPVAGVVELIIHAFGVYVGGVGFKAAHDTDIRPIRFFCRGVLWLAILTIAEQIYITIQINNSDIPNERIQFAYGAQAPSKDDIVSANIFQTIMLVIMWVIAIRHAYWHQEEVNAYNQSFAAAAMNAVPPVHLPEAV
uniref:Ubiquitin-like domain-containing protein n=1 Tax=Globisporangium ultimum (strain ATCC 200006 / CBS 805.95 / DAOM BR144) TaxID=431595 RepID=K3W7G2_GLOUD